MHLLDAKFWFLYYKTDVAFEIELAYPVNVDILNRDLEHVLDNEKVVMGKVDGSTIGIQYQIHWIGRWKANSYVLLQQHLNMV